MSSLAEQLRKKKATATSSKSDKDVKAEMLKIAIDEANAKFPGVMKLVEDIVALGVGMPTLEGELAKAVGVLSNPPQEVDVFKGEGELGEYACSTLEELQGLFEEAKGLLNETPPDAPKEPPEEANKAEPGEAAANAIEEAASDTPKVKKTRGKGKAKDQGGEAANAAAEKTPTNVEEAPSGAAATPSTAVPASAEKFYFYVNAIPSVPFESFWPVVNDTMTFLADKLSSEENKAIPDVRLGDPNGKGGFGRWKGLICAYLQNYALPKSGHFVLDGVFNEVTQEVAFAMRSIVASMGGVYVQGTR